MKRRHLVAVLIIGGVLLLSLFSVLAPRGALSGRGVSLGAAPTVAVIRIEGIIATGLGGSTLFESVSGSDSIVSLLSEARKDPSVRAVVLRVNSPGGSAAGAQEIAAEIAAVREAGKVVVTSMGDVAASGAYWVASVTDHIVANPGTLTGSIGVIMEVANYEGLFEKLGIDYEVLVSGEHKDMGSPLRRLTEEERRILLSMVEDIFNQFVEAVAAGRGLSREELLPLADGRVFTGSQALDAGLVDSLGGLRAAIDKAADLAGIEGWYRVKELGRRSPWEILLSEIGSLLRALGLGFGGTGLRGGALVGPEPELFLIRPADFLEHLGGEAGGP